ncbi:MAG: response regulator [Thermodesulfovibrionales bacterium]|nr:response regulator [Thermodesulfovibrionales bacterium]
MKDIKILFVDDEDFILKAIKRLFWDEQYTLLFANSAEEGLEMLKKEDPQIIVSDYRMPGMNGIDFLKKAFLLNPDSVRIVLSGYADTAVVIEAINEGQIYKLIPKPWNDEELKIAICNAVDRYLLHKRNIELTQEIINRNEELININKELQQLLKDKSELLDFKNRAITIFQNIIDAIPIGIIGVDFDGVMVQCNQYWLKNLGISWNNLGANVRSFLPMEVVEFIENVKNNREKERQYILNNISGKLIGTLIKDELCQQKGIILTFIPFSLIK